MCVHHKIALYALYCIKLCNHFITIKFHWEILGLSLPDEHCKTMEEMRPHKEKPSTGRYPT